MIPFSSLQWSAPGASKFQFLSLHLIDTDINKKCFLPLGNLPFLEMTKHWQMIQYGVLNDKVSSGCHGSMKEEEHLDKPGGVLLELSHTIGKSWLGFLKSRKDFPKKKWHKVQILLYHLAKHIMEGDRYKPVFVKGCSSSDPICLQQ